MLRAWFSEQCHRVPAAALARRLYHHLDRHRLDDATGLLDIGFRGHGFGSDRDGFRAEVSAWLGGFSDLRVVVHRLVTEDDRVAAAIALRGTHDGRFAGLAPTGRAIDITGMDLLLERGGRFVEAWSLRDLNALWVQLGALPPSPRSDRTYSAGS